MCSFQVYGRGFSYMYMCIHSFFKNVIEMVQVEGHSE